MREGLDGLPDPLIGSILHNLSDTDLLNVRATQRRLKAAADSLSKARFHQRWGIESVSEAPRCAPLYLAARARHFAWRHELGPHETLASVALRYDCEAAVLRRCNNLMDDAGAACRTHLFIPVEDVAAVRGCTAAFVRCQHVGRRFVVAFAPDARSARPAGAPAPRAGASEKLVGMLERSLRVDRFTALYYLSHGSGSLRAAIAAHERDAGWAAVSGSGPTTRRQRA
ncbi:hypothetical protein ACKKBF_B19610 [Auxenochlorella protothecoides x Auxenochlorella symbiontica]